MRNTTIKLGDTLIELDENGKLSGNVKRSILEHHKVVRPSTLDRQERSRLRVMGWKGQTVVPGNREVIKLTIDIEDLLYDLLNRSGALDKLPTLNINSLITLAVKEALNKANYKQKDAAPLLGWTPRQLNYWIKKLKIKHPAGKWKER